MKINLKVIIIIILLLIGIILFVIINRKKNIDYFEDNLPPAFAIDIGKYNYDQKTDLYYPENAVNLASYIGILLSILPKL